MSDPTASIDEAVPSRARVASPISSAEDIAAAWPEILARYPGDSKVVRIALETGAAFIHRQPTGFAVLSIHYADYGEKELYAWFVTGRQCGQYTADLRALARSLGCLRATTRVERRGFLRLMPKHGWRMKSVEFFVEA